MRRFALPVAILIALASRCECRCVAPCSCFKGHGWGHGVGLSQYGALGRANDGQDYKQILGFYYDGTNVGTTSQNKIRVLLTAGLSSVTLRSSEDFKVGDKTLTRLTDWKVVPTSDGKVRVVGKGKFGDPATAKPGKGFLKVNGLSLSRRPEDLQQGRQARRRQRRRAAGLPLLGRPARDAVELAARGAQGASGRRARLRGCAPRIRAGTTSTTTPRTRSTADSTTAAARIPARPPRSRRPPVKS